ncbi:MAG TPA: hypothetical protein VFR44_14350 [Actinomycetota bacterium]|nr:hypothetical protein [Actinomycetota bacterium]
MLPVLFVVGVVLIADALWFDDPVNEARPVPTRPSPSPAIPTPTASSTAPPSSPSATAGTSTPTAVPTSSHSPERWSFCKNVSDVEDLRRAVLRGTRPPRGLVEQAEELEAHLTDPRLDDLKDVVGRLRRAILDADAEYPSDFEVQGWAEALELVSTTAQVQLGCRGGR